MFFSVRRLLCVQGKVLCNKHSDGDQRDRFFLKKKTNDIAVGARMSDFVRSLCTENVVAVISP